MCESGGAEGGVYDNTPPHRWHISRRASSRGPTSSKRSNDWETDHRQFPFISEPLNDGSLGRMI